MGRDRYVSEHQQYAKRLTELEKRSAQAQRVASKSVHHIGYRLPQLRWHHYKINGERVFKLVFLFGIVLLLALYVISPLSKVKTVTVKGNDQLNQLRIEHATQIYPGRFIWGIWIHQQQICRQTRLRQPRLASVKIKITGPQSVYLTVRENALLGMAHLGQENYAVLADGRLQKVTSKYQVGINYQYFTGHRQALKQVARQLSKLKPAVRDGISTVVYRPTKEMPERIILYMRDGNTVLANQHTVGNKMSYYPAIAANMKQAGVINLQVGAYSYTYGSKDK